MIVSRRTFAIRSLTSIGLLATLGSTIGLTGCSLFTNIANYVGVGLQAFQAIVNILMSAGVIPPGAGTLIAAAILAVKAAFADVSAAIADYENAPAADKATFLGKVSTTLSAVVAELNHFWGDLNIPDSKLASLIEGLLGIIVSTLAAFIAQVPAPPTPTPAVATKKRIVVAPQKRSPTQFRKAFNQLVIAGGYPQNQII